MIANNAGYEGNLIVEKIKEKHKENPNVGFNALTGEFVDMFEAGIIDPTKVVRSAIQNAASVSGLLLTTEAVVVEIKEQKKEGGAPSDLDF